MASPVCRSARHRHSSKNATLRSRPRRPPQPRQQTKSPVETDEVQIHLGGPTLLTSLLGMTSRVDSSTGFLNDQPLPAATCSRNGRAVRRLTVRRAPPFGRRAAYPRTPIITQWHFRPERTGIAWNVGSLSNIHRLITSPPPARSNTSTVAVLGIPPGTTASLLRGPSEPGPRDPGSVRTLGSSPQNENADLDSSWDGICVRWAFTAENHGVRAIIAQRPQEMRVPGLPRWCGGHHPVGDAESGPTRLSFNPQLRVEFRGATVTSDAGLLLPRELDERLGLDALIERHCADPRRGHNRQFPLPDLFRQSISSRLAGYEDTNDAERLAEDPTFRMLASPERRRASRSPRRSTGSRPTSSRRSGTIKDSLASTRD